MDAFTLDQFLVFATVAEEGSFNAAARKLGRAQSAVTYAIQKLEDQADTLLFDRSAYRPVLTEAGRALLPQADRVLSCLADFRRTASSFTDGLEAEVHLAVHALMPMNPVYDVLCNFSKRFPDTSVCMHSIISGLDEFLSQYPGAMAFIPNLTLLDEGNEANGVGEVQLVAVAAPSHPLTKLPSPLGPNILAEYFQIVLGGQHHLSAGRDRGIQATRRWYADNLHIKRELILNGLGWGSLPRHMAKDELAAGQLVELLPDRWDGADQMPRIPCVLVRSQNASSGPAGAWLFTQLSTQNWPSS